MAIYRESGSGPFTPAALGINYRGLKLQSNADAVDLVVESDGVEQSLHLEPAEVFSGRLKIISGTLTGLIGYKL